MDSPVRAYATYGPKHLDDSGEAEKIVQIIATPLAVMISAAIRLMLEVPFWIETGAKIIGQNKGNVIMSGFETYGKFDLKNSGLTVESVAPKLAQRMEKYYKASDIKQVQDGIVIDGNVKGFLTFANTEAIVRLKIEDRTFSYNVSGKSSPGMSWAYCFAGMFFIRLFGGMLLPGLDGIADLLFIAGIGILISFLFCRNLPKKYFEESLKGLQFDLS